MNTNIQYALYKVKGISLAEWGSTEIKFARSKIFTEQYDAWHFGLSQLLADYISVKVEGPFKLEHYPIKSFLR